MSTIAERIAVLVRPPRQGEVYRKAITTGSVSHTIPAGWKNRMVTMRAIGQDLQYQFGSSGQSLTLVLDQVSAGTPPAMTGSNATGATLKDGEEIAIVVTDETQFAVIGAAASGYFELYLSSQPHTTTGLA